MTAVTTGNKLCSGVNNVPGFADLVGTVLANPMISLLLLSLMLP